MSGPATLVYPSPLVQRQAARRIQILTQTPYVTITAVDSSSAFQLFHLPLVSLAYIYTDASKDESPEVRCYMAGYCHGLRWRIPITGALQSLPIVALEFLAWVFSFIIFYRWIKHHAGIVLCSDSYTSVQIVQRDAAHSKLMQTLHAMLLDTWEYQQLHRRLLVGHVFSEGNTMADHDSRGKYSECKLVAAQLGIRLRTLSVPPRVPTCHFSGAFQPKPPKNDQITQAGDIMDICS